MSRALIFLVILNLSSVALHAQQGLLQGARKKLRQTERETNTAKSDMRRMERFFSSEKKTVTPEENVADTIAWEKERYIPQRGVVNDYAYLFRSLHGKYHQVKFKNTKNLNKIVWDSTDNRFYNRLDKINALNKGDIVFGWHPYWMKDDFKNYNYNLLSIISYYSYDIDPNSGLYNDADAINDWKTTAMIDSAKAHDVKVLLSITNYGAAETNAFLQDEMLWGRMIDSVDMLLNMRGGAGVDIDFEGLTENNKEAFTRFVKQVKSKLGDARMVTVQVPAYNNHGGIDFFALNDVVDLYVVQGYDYSRVDCGGKPGPVSPLLTINSNCPCIVNTFDYCIRNGLKPAKAILGLPAYGTEWTLKGNSWDAKANFDGYITYSDVMARYGQDYETSYDPVSGSSFFIVDQGKQTKLVWYESSEGLEMKFKWALDHGMKGAAIWSLGYDGNQPGITNAIAKSFGMKPLQRIEPIDVDNGRLYGMVESLVEHKRAIGVGLIIIVYFFVLGLFISLFDWRVREIFFQNFTYRALFAGVIIVLSIVSVSLLVHPEGGLGAYLFPLLIGLVIGAVIVYLVTNRYISYRNKLP
ncbi:glycosyl hydrolase family 18 protein [Fulvivirga maritima]|uniref:glycosyl hydrolase family 18 protein n=1 Tax=Fulvivirga maritima TaxID=2904247 RepID=UPI001F3834DE|nr:glycosyl hydrolase family 18 protein [Fulvivirga maritima]UII27391.1 glycosyl hydrolase family 18 protein [Fulvivirga maritima]